MEEADESHNEQDARDAADYVTGAQFSATAMLLREFQRGTDDEEDSINSEEGHKRPTITNHVEGEVEREYGGSE